MEQLKRLPVGIQTFEKIIENDMLYIDKTEYILRMIDLSNYVFLSRPRRFGKSLLLSTIQAYFEGRKELFKGLFVDRVEKDWVEHPVLRFDMSMGKHLDKKQLERYLHYLLEDNETRFGVPTELPDVNLRLRELIVNVYKKTGKPVVMLIDEYDAPLLDVVHEDSVLPELRRVIRNFVSPIKGSDPYLKFVFITGISKFSQLSIFSELNNLTNISMDPEFAGVCGITEKEMLEYMPKYIEQLATVNNWTFEEAISQLRQQYDGYHFTWPSSDIFNPYSLLNALQNNRMDSYWFASGTPTYLIEMMQKFDTLPTDLNMIECGADDFDAPTEGMTTILPLLYQSGYLTIKDYDKQFKGYTLSIPNKEVEVGLSKSLVPTYLNTNTLAASNIARSMAKALTLEDIDGMLRLLQTFLGTVPYCNNANSEGHYQQVLYIIFTLLSDYSVDVEIHTPTGRVDIVMRCSKALYLFELKLNKDATTAMEQINLKDYASRFAFSELPVVKVAINFDINLHNITDWKIEEA